ncbi:27737_t:CDS:1, partial [Dentiscutata erythropus]
MMINVFDVEERFDIQLNGIGSKELHGEISKRLNIEYLSDYLNTKELKEVTGIIYGYNIAIFVSLPVKVKHQVKNVHFLIDTGSPRTYVCGEVYDSFKITVNNSTVPRVLINSKPIFAHLSPNESHFTDINVLGSEYLKLTGARLFANYEDEDISILFESFNEDIQNIKVKTNFQVQENFQLKPYTLDKFVGFCLF